MDWLTTAQEVLALLTGLVGLISAGVSVFFAIKNFISAMKTKSSAELWGVLMSVADAAMTEVETSNKPGAEKKQLVIDIVKASCTAAGLDVTAFLDQLDAYIDNCISFANNINRNK